jgi:pimeloyl-ACP methyl ester carboxylesterase
VKGRAVRTAIRDGVSLRYEQAGGEGAAIVLVHGWCCDHTFLQPQLDYLAARGHTVVAVDLRGHGESDRPEQAYSMGAFADDIAWLAGELHLSRPVIIGHSMGGVVAFELALRHPGLAGAIVMIDSPVTRPEASRAKMPAFLETLRSGDYRAAVSTYVEQALYLPTDAPDRRAAILAKMLQTERHVMTAAFQGLYEFDAGAAAGRTFPPSLYIAANARPLTEMPRLLALVPQLLSGQTVGSGHFCPLEVPDQVNAMIARFLSVSGAAGSAGPRDVR